MTIRPVAAVIPVPASAAVGRASLARGRPTHRCVRDGLVTVGLHTGDGQHQRVEQAGLLP